MDIPVILSQIAGVAIVITGLVLGGNAYFVYNEAPLAVWIFLSTAVIPVACGVLIIVAAEILLRLGNSDDKPGLLQRVFGVDLE